MSENSKKKNAITVPQFYIQIKAINIKYKTYTKKHFRVLKPDFLVLPYSRLSLRHGNKTDSTSDRVGLCDVKLETFVESLPDPI